MPSIDPPRSRSRTQSAVAGAADCIVSFRVDEWDTLIAVNREFIRFANANGWGVSRSEVLGTSLWDHLHGEQVIAFHRMLIAAVRAGREEVRVPIRCDSPTEKRWLEVSFSPGMLSDVAVSAEPLDAEPREYQVLFEGSNIDGDGDLDACAWCARFRIGDEWLEAEAASERLGLLTGVPVPTVKPSICERCQKLIHAAAFPPSDRL